MELIGSHNNTLQSANDNQQFAICLYTVQPKPKPSASEYINTFAEVKLGPKRIRSWHLLLCPKTIPPGQFFWGGGGVQTPS